MEEHQSKKEAIKHTEDDIPTTPTQVKQKPLLMYGAVALVAIMILGTLLYSQGFIVAAKVNGESISRLSVIRELESQAGAGVLDNLISNILIEQAATEAGIMITEAEIETELSMIEAQISEQGGTLDGVLAQQGLTRETLSKQIRTQKMLESLLESDVVVTDAEIDAFLADNGPVPEGQQEAVRVQVAEQLKSQKLTTAAQSYVTGLRTQANIQYIVDYE